MIAPHNTWFNLLNTQQRLLYGQTMIKGQFYFLLMMTGRIFRNSSANSTDLQVVRDYVLAHKHQHFVCLFARVKLVVVFFFDRKKSPMGGDTPCSRWVRPQWGMEDICMCCVVPSTKNPWPCTQPIASVEPPERNTYTICVFETVHWAKSEETPCLLRHQTLSIG